MSQHVVPVRVYVAVFAALIVLTAITVWAATRDFGVLNTVVALGIAVTKATLVVLFFMHLKYSGRLTWLVVAGGVLFLGILLSATLSDYVSRAWFPAWG